VNHDVNRPGVRHYHQHTEMDDVRSDTGTAAERGFLFSDMRGFTAFAERHGNAAAAAAVARFLDVARKAIAKHDGAELKTEGDAIHAVFPSATGAVLCGLEIVDAAAELNEREPDRRLDLGVGVHAGDAVETAEGYIGSAVNLAARLCAAARPGEVLVTSTVKNATQSSIPVGFIARGRQRLKGISEPVEVYAVTRDLTARTAVVLPRLGLALAASGMAAVVLVAIVALGATLLPGTLNPTPQPVVMGPLAIGEYAPQAFEPRLTFDIADTGWSANRDAADLFGLVREAAPAGSVFFTRVDEVIAQPCIQGAEGTVGPGATDVIADLQGLEHLDVTDAVPVEVGGLPGRQVDVTVSEGALAACGGLVGADVALFGLGDEIWSATPGERFRLVAVTVGDAEMTVLMSIDWTQAHSVQELEDLFAIGGALLDTVEFPAAQAT
jgi:class 3 adenylate cyclase